MHLAIALAQVANMSIAIENVSIIRPGSMQALSAQTVTIENGKITSVGPTSAAKAAEGTRTIDGKGKFLMPGLWDMHVHWYEESSLGLFTANGVVGVRQMFGQPKHLDWRKRAEQGSMVGPRWIVGSPIVDGPKPMWKGSIELKSPEEAKALVTKLKSEGWDFIKVYESLSAEVYRELALEARLQKMPFEGHLPMAINVLEAGRLGQKTIEHLGNIRQSCTPFEADYRSMIEKAMAAPDREKALNAGYAEFDKKHPYNRMNTIIAIDTFKKLAKTGAWQCPTLTVMRSLSSLNQPEFLKDARLKYLNPDIVKNWNPANDFRLKEWTRDDYEYWSLDYQRKFSIVKMLLDTGNRFLAGTDCLNPYCFPGFSLHDELDLLVQAGLNPAQAIEAATLNPARYMKQEKLWGSIEKGKRADVVLLNRNPLEEIRNTTSIESVIQGGRLFERVELDAILKANEHALVVK